MSFGLRNFEEDYRLTYVGEVLGAVLDVLLSFVAHHDRGYAVLLVLHDVWTVWEDWVFNSGNRTYIEV